ncbi:MAG: hypothetical protein Q9195_006227 [Heterodermia aff. obscurata]
MYSVYLSYVALLGISFCAGNPTPAPAPSPTKFIEPRATTCNADNCYRAAKSINEDQTGGHYGSIVPLCSSYTSPSTPVTTLTSSPLTLPSSCSAPRISSICDCLVPAPPCATRAAAQRVENPSFELGPGGGNGVPYWSVTDTANNWAIYNTNERDYQGDYGVTIWADGASGVFTATQTVSLCPGYKYAFSAYIGYAYFDDPSITPIFNNNVTVYLNDQVIIPTQPACTSRAQCNKPTPKKPVGYDDGFRQLTGSVTASAGSATLKIVIGRDVSGNTQPGGYDVYHTADTLLDLITLTKAA